MNLSKTGGHKRQRIGEDKRVTGHHSMGIHNFDVVCLLTGFREQVMEVEQNKGGHGALRGTEQAAFLWSESQPNF